MANTLASLPELLSNQLVTLLPVIVGALITGITSFIATSLQAKQTAALNNKEAMRGSFSEVLNALYDVRMSLRYLSDSQSGRQSEFTAKTDAEYQESHDRDMAGVASIERLSEANDRADKAAVHMSVYASESVMQAYRTLEDTLHEDSQAIIDEARETNKFVAAHFNKLMDSFDDNLRELTSAMGDDLNRPKRRKR